MTIYGTQLDIMQSNELQIYFQWLISIGLKVMKTNVSNQLQTYQHFVRFSLLIISNEINIQLLDIKNYDESD